MSVRNGLSLLALSMTLVACGGNDTEATTTSTIPVNSAPVVSAGTDQTVVEGSTVTLSSTSSDADGDTITLTWSQTSGTSVTLSSTTVSSPTFTAPDLSADETLEFQISASDSQATTTDTVLINVTDEASLPAYATSFDADSLEGSPSLVSCTLSDGAASTCMSVTLKSSPQNYNVGPWCPRNISDDASAGGIWLENGTDYEVDGSFISNLNTFYNDNTWQMYDTTTGEVTYTKTKTECSEAANPDVGVEYENYCVECQVSFIDEGLTNTYLIPISPVDGTQTSQIGRGASVGVGFSGVLFDASAPVDAILGAYTLAPFDDCGGHINLNAGYHVHAVTDADCHATIDNTSGHAAQIGVAMDGYPLYERLNGTVEPTDLDSCRGHDTDQAFGVDGYHYHANEPGANAIIGCHAGQTAN